MRNLICKIKGQDKAIFRLPRWLALVVKNPPANAGDTRDVVSIAGLGRHRGEGNGNMLQYPCLENSRTEEPGGLLSMGSQQVGHD